MKHQINQGVTSLPRIRAAGCTAMCQAMTMCPCMQLRLYIVEAKLGFKDLLRKREIVLCFALVTGDYTKSVTRPFQQMLPLCSLKILPRRTTRTIRQFLQQLLNQFCHRVRRRLAATARICRPDFVPPLLGFLVTLLHGCMTEMTLTVTALFLVSLFDAFFFVRLRHCTTTLAPG